MAEHLASRIIDFCVEKLSNSRAKADSMSEAIALGLTGVPRPDLDYFEAQCDSPRINQRLSKTRYKYSILLYLAVTFPLNAESILHLGVNDIDISAPTEIWVSKRDSKNLFFGYSWLVENNWSLKCLYQSFAIGGFRVDANSLGTQQSAVISHFNFYSGSSVATYLGIEAGWRRTKFGSVRESGLVIGSRLGIRYFFNDAVSIDTSISYKYSTGDVFIVDFDTTDNYFYPGLGLKASFK